MKGVTSSTIIFKILLFSFVVNSSYLTTLYFSSSNLTKYSSSSGKLNTYFPSPSAYVLFTSPSALDKLNSTPPIKLLFSSLIVPSIELDVIVTGSTIIFLLLGFSLLIIKLGFITVPYGAFDTITVIFGLEDVVVNTIFLPFSDTTELLVSLNLAYLASLSVSVPVMIA